MPVLCVRAIPPAVPARVSDTPDLYGGYRTIQAASTRLPVIVSSRELHDTAGSLIAVYVFIKAESGKCGLLDGAAGGGGKYQ